MKRHYPEWTDFNSSDPGVTLLQLFAFLAEGLLYRASLISKQNDDCCEAIIRVLESKQVLARAEVLKEMRRLK